MGVRSRNRRVGVTSVCRNDFPDVERIVHSLTAARLEKAKAELEASGKTADKGVDQLLRSLSLYGHRQPMSRESRLTLRRKIKFLSPVWHPGHLVYAQPERYYEPGQAQARSISHPGGSQPKPSRF